MTKTEYRIMSNQPIALTIQPDMLDERRVDADFYRPEYVENETRIRSCGHKIRELESLWIEGRYGTLPDSGDYGEGNVVLIRGGDFANLDIIDDEHLVKVPDGYWETAAKARTQPGEILLLAKGASIDGPNSVAICSSRFQRALVNGSVFRIKPKPEINNAFLAAYMATPTFLRQKRRSISNTGISYNDLGAIGGFLVPLPPRPVQEYIGAKVRLAERCRLQARELRSTTRHLLRKYARLDEVEQASKKQDTHRAFWVEPSTIVGERMDSEFYQPHHVRIEAVLKNGPWRHLAYYISAPVKGIQPEYDSSGTVPAVTVTHIDPDQIMIDAAPKVAPTWVGQNVRAKPNPGELLITVTGPPLGETVVVHSHHGLFIVNSHVARIKPKAGFPYPNYLSTVLNSLIGVAQVYRFCKGVRQKELYSDDLLSFAVPEISTEIIIEIDRCGRQADMLFDSAGKLVAEAKADVEALIEGQLDVDGILSGRLQPPTWAAIASATGDGVAATLP